MKLLPLLTAAAVPLATLTLRAEDPTPAGKCEMCEQCGMCKKMKKEEAAAPAPMAMCEKMKKAPAPAAAATILPELKKQAAEIDKLVTTMNGSVGAEKLEAMAAVITRLAAENKTLLEHAAKAHPAATEAAPAGHQH